jgi:hypothetical protein
MQPAVPKAKGRVVSSNASLQIYGVELNFDTIARELATSATSTRRKGDATRSGYAIKNDLWSIASPLERSSQLDEHLRWLANLLQPRLGFLRALVRDPEIWRVNIFSAVTIDGRSCGLKLPHESLSFLAELGIGMELSLVFLNLSDSNEVISDQHESEVASRFSKDDRYKTESRVTIAVPSRDPAVHHTLSSLGLRFAKSAETPSDGAGFQVPLSELEDFDSQLKWLARSLSQSDRFVQQLTRNVDITCGFATECQWGGTWLSGEALRLPVLLHIPLGFQLRLLPVEATAFRK